MLAPVFDSGLDASTTVTETPASSKLGNSSLPLLSELEKQEEISDHLEHEANPVPMRNAPSSALLQPM